MWGAPAFMKREKGTADASERESEDWRAILERHRRWLTPSASPEAKFPWLSLERKLPSSAVCCKDLQ